MADNIINARIQQKADTEANWKAKDPVILKNEIVFTTDGANKNKYKLGEKQICPKEMLLLLLDIHLLPVIHGEVFRTT